MTTLLDKAIQAIRRLPQNRQDELAQAILDAAAPTAQQYSADQLAAIDEGIADAEAGRFVSDDDLEQLFTRYRTLSGSG